MTRSLIVAMAEHRVIGQNNRLPWHLPADLRRFRELTMGHAIIMGRRTYESIGKPLPGRKSIVLSRNSAYQPPGVLTANSLESAWKLAMNDDHVFVIGGSDIFRVALPLVDRIYLTRIHADIQGDTYFPEMGDEWKLVQSEKHPIDARNAFPMTFEVWERDHSSD